ncbi:MAG: aldo/keto reductase [Myxococcota bacterium]
MKTTVLGRTGMTISRLCLGCMSFGTPAWRPWVLDEHQARPFFRRALEAGINFFDTADFYSDGVSEEVTGKCLREMASLEEVVIATKVYFGPDRPNMTGLSRKHVQQACEASLRRLGVETIDLYQVHRLDPATPIDETLRALDDLVRAGKVRHVGGSSMYAWELTKALGVSERLGLARFESLQTHYNLVYREDEREIMPLCETEDVAVLPWSPLARGLLAGSRKGLREKAGSKRQETDAIIELLYDEDSDWEVVEAVLAVARERGRPPAQIALAWMLGKPWVTAPLVGVTKLAQLDDAIAALELELTPAEIGRLEAPYRPHAPKGMGRAALYRPARRH